MATKLIDTFKEISIEILISIIIAIFIVTFVSGNMGFIAVVNGESMEPTFKEGDVAVLNVIGVRTKGLKKGDIVVFNLDKKNNSLLYNTKFQFIDLSKNIKRKLGVKIDSSSENLIKRVVAVSGDTVDIRNGNLYINGALEQEESKKGYTYAYDLFDYPMIIQEDDIFVLGDNRENSLDSRMLGPVNIKNIKGKILYKFKSKK